MKTILQMLSELVANAFAACGYDPALGTVCASSRPDLCPFQCNGAFAAAKQYHKAPREIAENVAAQLQTNEAFQKLEVIQPGFINITPTDAYLVSVINTLAADAHLGIPQAERRETVLLDYGGPNVAKPLHIGHLRSAIIGESLKRLAHATGRRVISDVHLGDWGLQMGLVIAELEARYPSWGYFTQDSGFEQVTTAPALDVDILNAVYPFASKKSKEDSAFKAKADAATFALQNGDPGYTALWKEIVRVSVADLKKSYDKLNVSFDYWYGESNAAPFIEPLLQTLKDKQLLFESDGAMVVDVGEPEDKEPIPPILIQKSDKSNIYATTDLATIIQRQTDFAPDKCWYVVDKRQSLHFKQVFRCARKAGLVPADTQLEHLGFGTMNGSDGKPYKTRDGGVMQLSDLLQTVIGAVCANSDFTEDDPAAWKIGIAAIKFGDLINHRMKDYIFDLDKFVSFEGKSGVYLLYTITRINSILRKLELAGEWEHTYTAIATKSEQNLLMHILLSSEAFLHAVEEKTPNYICESAYTIASAFSSFYHDNSIINESDPVRKSAWISLCILTKKVLIQHLDVLGIESVEQM